MRSRNNVKSYQHESSIDLVFRQSLRSLAHLERQVRKGRKTVSEFEKARWTLEALPLPFDQFSVAVNRLANASTYAARSESGLAMYELRMLCGLVSRCAAAYAFDDVRRFRRREA